MWRALGVPDDPAPDAEGGTGVEDGHAADLAPREPNSGRHDPDAAAGLDQRDQRLRVARLQEDAGGHVGDAASAGEHFPGTESLGSCRHSPEASSTGLWNTPA